MALIYCKTEGLETYLVDPYWCAEDWFIKCSDDELVIGVLSGRSNTMDKTLMTRMRRTLRILKIKGRVGLGDDIVWRESGVFRVSEGGDGFRYSYKSAGVCNLVLNGPVTVDLSDYLDHGMKIEGLADLTNQTIYGC